MTVLGWERAGRAPSWYQPWLFLLHLLVPEGIDGAQGGRSKRGVQASEDAHQDRDARGQRDRVRRQQHRTPSIRNRTTKSPASTPKTPPSNEMTTASIKNWPSTTDFGARALRMPISHVRSVTVTSMMFITPIAPTLNKDTAATHPSSAVPRSSSSTLPWRAGWPGSTR